MNQSLNHYYTFYMVARCGNLSEAARKLFISQPAVSKAINKLEEELNVRLFDRTSRGVILTEAGELLFHQLEIAFRAIESGEQKLYQYDAVGAGHLSIGVSATLCKYVLLPYLKEFVTAYPNIRINIKCQSSYETIQELKNGSLDIGLIGETEHMEALAFLPYRQIQDGFVATDEYLSRFGYVENEFGDRLLHEGTLLLLDSKNYSRQYIDRYLSSESINCERVLEASTMDLLIDFALAGLGIACLITDFVQKELEKRTLVRIHTREPIPSRQIGFAYSSQKNLTASMERFLKGL